jgi:SAM-dependent methyltransferase
MLAELFDGTGPFAIGLGAERLSEGLTRILVDGDTEQQAAAEESVEASKRERRAGVVAFHARIAEGQLTEQSFLRGRALAERLGYPTDALDQLPDRVVERFIGLANPFVFGRARPGEVVVDVGCGAGLDSTIAALDVGPTGLVLGLDATFLMVKVAHGMQRPVAAAPTFGQSVAEQLPVGSDSVDLVTSNGVFNLCDRPVVLAECLRVLKPGGRLQFGDLTYETTGRNALTAEWWSFRRDRLTEARWHDLLTDCGFVDVRSGPVTHPEGLRPMAPLLGRAYHAAKPR